MIAILTSLNREFEDKGGNLSRFSNCPLHDFKMALLNHVSMMPDEDGNEKAVH